MSSFGSVSVSGEHYIDHGISGTKRERPGPPAQRVCQSSRSEQTRARGRVASATTDPGATLRT